MFNIGANMSKILKQAQQMKDNMQKAQVYTIKCSLISLQKIVYMKGDIAVP